MSSETVLQGNHSCSTLVAGLAMAGDGGEQPAPSIDDLIRAL